MAQQTEIIISYFYYLSNEFRIILIPGPIVLDIEIFFTMEHNSKISQSTYAGYQVRNIGETDLYITIKNIYGSIKNIMLTYPNKRCIIYM